MWKSFVTSTGAHRHPWVRLLFHISPAGMFHQVCILDRTAVVMTSYIRHCDSAAVSGPLKTYVVRLDTGKHSCNDLLFCSMHRLAGRLFTTSRPFFVGAVIGVRVHRPLHICVDHNTVAILASASRCRLISVPVDVRNW